MSFRHAVAWSAVAIIAAACAGQAGAPVTTPGATSTPAPGMVTTPVDMSGLQTYTYSSGIFSIKIPTSWTSQNKSTEGEVLVAFGDASGNGAALVDVFEQEAGQSEEDLITTLERHLDRAYSGQAAFTRNAPKVQGDGSILIVWGYDATLSSGATARLVGDSFIEQRDSYVIVLTLALPDEQFDGLKTQIDEVLNSLQVVTAVPISSGAPPTAVAGVFAPVVFGDLVTYTYSTSLFSILAPSSWTKTDASTPGEAIVVWTDPTENGLIAVDLFAEDPGQTEDELTAFLQDYLRRVFGDKTSFLMDTAKPQTDDSVLIVWSYTAAAPNGGQAKVLGNSFIEQRDDKVSLLTSLVPDAQFDVLLASTNAILNSYAITPSADLP